MQNYRSMLEKAVRSKEFWHSKLELDVTASPPAPKLRRAGKLEILAKNL